jgi:hypothetical protein
VLSDSGVRRIKDDACNRLFYRRTITMAVPTRCCRSRGVRHENSTQ